MGYDDSNQIQALSSTSEGYLRTQPILPILDTSPDTLNVGSQGPSIDVSQYGNLTVQLVVTGLVTSVTVRLEGSLDGTNWWNFNTNNVDLVVNTSVTAIKQQGISADKFIRLVFVSADGGTPSISYRVFAR